MKTRILLLFFLTLGIGALFSEETQPWFPRPLRGNPTLDAGTAQTVPAPLVRYPPSAPSQLLSDENMNQPLTVYYLAQYTSRSGLKWLKMVLTRGGPYMAFIRERLEKAGLPDELVYLPIVESQYLANAMSRSGAAGLWQFMRNSSLPLGLKVTEWVDERCDFWLSTEAAVKKLKENYDYLGNWPLALAAYNAGLGAVSSAVKRGQTRNYWELCARKLLKTETIYYVPKLLAIAYIVTNARRFGLDPVWIRDPHWTRVDADRQADISLLAEKAGINAKTLREGNRELLYNVTPPGKGYRIKTPAANAQKIAAVFADKSVSLVKYYYYKIHSGDTLLALALHYGITVAQIKAANGGLHERYLKIGSTLKIPALKEVSPYIRPEPEGSELDWSGEYTVRQGDTLWSLALFFAVDPELLAEKNHIGLNQTLSIGKRLKTPIK